MYAAGHSYFTCNAEKRNEFLKNAILSTSSLARKLKEKKIKSEREQEG